LADNDIMTDFIDRMRRWACGKYKKNKRLGYIWCRELSSDKGLHYHLVLLLNGNEVQSHYYVLEKAKQIAEHHAHRGYERVPHFGDNPMHMMIDRDVQGDYERAFEWASYLAKARTKDNKHRSDRANNYQTSRIKPRLNEHGDIFTSGDDYKKAIAAKANRAKQVTPKTTATEKPLHMMTDDERQLPLFT
uniref:YagK/YfjJ domain-containing protein n=1 Tax=uncultured Psychrobacter sp. TaxID=259303 RepID=UPI0025940C36